MKRWITCAKLRYGVSFISHDLDYVAKYADKVVPTIRPSRQTAIPKVYESQAFHRVFGDATYAYGNNVGHVRKVEGKKPL